MGEELPLAREEEEGQSMLLAIAGNGELITASCLRNERTQESNVAEDCYGGEIEDTETESKVSRKVKRANASSSKPARRRRDNKDRESNRGDEGEHKPTRRSAQELGITFPGAHCDELETVPHHWVEVGTVSGNSLYQCKFCHKYLCLPMSSTDATRLGNLMKYRGSTEGYCRYLNTRRAAKLLIAKLQDLRRLDMEITDKREFARMVDKIMSDREYDRKEVM